MEGLTLKVFKELHDSQLRAIGLPEHLAPLLYSKLCAKNSRYERKLAQSFEIYPDSTLTATGYAAKCKLSLQPGADVFVVQHVWESDGSSNARQQLCDDPELLVRVEALLGIEQSRDGDLERTTERMVRTVHAQSGKSENIARKALVDTNYDLIAALVLAESLSDTDCEDGKDKEDQAEVNFEEFKQGVMASLGPGNDVPDHDLRPLYEGYLKEKTRVEDDSGHVHCGTYSWREDDDGTMTVSIPIPAGTKKSDIISKLRSGHWMFGIRECKPILDKEFSNLVVPDESFWTLEGTTVTVNVQKLHVEERWGSLLKGEVQLSQREVEKVKKIGEQRRAARVDAVFEKMWFVNQTYQAVTPEGQQRPVWYLMEQYGLALTHSSHPNFNCRPFANAVTGNVMSLVWPVREVQPGEVCSRDFVPLLFAQETDEQRAARKEAILSFIPNRPLQRTSCVPSIPERLPATQRKTRQSSWKLPSASSSPLKLYINGGTGSRERGSWESLEGFVVVTAPQSADIILGYSEETAIVPGQLVARLDGDVCLVSKTELCRLARGQSWFPPTVDIRQEVVELLCEEDCVVRSWYVLLPGERGSPIQPRVTRNKAEVVRWAEVGPCVASQFCLQMVEYEGCRTSLHYPVVVVSHSHEGGVYLHHCALVRVAEQKAAGGFDQWNTPTLLTSGSCEVPWADFLREFTARYKTNWTEVKTSIIQAVTELFTLALPHVTGRGAIYSVGLLVKHQTLAPLITGVQPLSIFPNSTTATQCLNLLVGRGGRDVEDNFVKLLPYRQN